MATFRNLPKGFNRGSKNFGELPPKTATAEEVVKFFEDQWYVLGDCSKSTGKIQVGMKNPTDTEIKRMINWLQRTLKYRAFLKGLKK